MPEIETSRRNLLYGIAAVGAAAPVLAACGAEDGVSGTPATPGGSTDPGPGAPTASETIPTSDIPVGGGAIYPAERLVVTQPTAGTFKAFDNTCTHSGCPVNQVKDGLILCPCHGSSYSIEDGSVQGGPAPSPLAAKPITVDGDSLTVG